MNAHAEFNVLNLRPDLGERLIDQRANRRVQRRWTLRPGVTGALVVIGAQVLIVSVGALFCTLCGVSVGS